MPLTAVQSAKVLAGVSGRLLNSGSAAFDLLCHPANGLLERDANTDLENVSFALLSFKQGKENAIATVWIWKLVKGLLQ